MEKVTGIGGFFFRAKESMLRVGSRLGKARACGGVAVVSSVAMGRGRCDL